MSLPRKLRNFNLFHNGESYAGQIPELTLPKLSRKMEDYQAGGMSGPVKTDQGQEAIQFEWTAGGFIKTALQQYGALKHDAVLLRFAGAYRAEDSTTHDSIEVIVRGRHQEIDFGTAKLKDDTAHKFTTVASYYKLSVNNSPIIEFDFVNMIENVNGVDLLQDLRTAIGL